VYFPPLEDAPVSPRVALPPKGRLRQMSNHKSTESALKNLEVQVGQLAKQIADKSSNSFVANTKQNPKEECKTVMTRSKRFVEVKDKDSVVHKKKLLTRKVLMARKMR